MKNRILPLIGLLVSLLLSACGPAQVEPSATQTAAVPASQPTPDPIRLEADGSGDYPTLGEAVRNAPESSTIRLGPGTYRLAQPLDVSKSLRLVGAGMDQTEIVSSAEGYVVRFTGGGRFAAEDITFRHEGEAMADVVTVLGGEVVFIRCRFTGAVYVEGAGNRAGLRLRQGASGLVRECVVVDNDNTGILVENRALPMLDRNICTRNGVVGIGYVDEAGGVARENQCSENAVGIGVSNDARPTLERNVCRDNEYHGIAFWDSASGTAYRNECVGNGVGIFVGETANPDLVENNCYDNAEEDVHDLRP